LVQSAFDVPFITAQWGDAADEIFRSVLEMFAGEAPGLCIDAQAGLAENRRADVQRAAHTMRGAAANVGAARLASCAETLEAAALTADHDAIAGMVADMQSACDTVVTVIAAGGPTHDAE
jgi:two-component system, sensor histidine kinase and response regulator